MVSDQKVDRSASTEIPAINRTVTVSFGNRFIVKYGKDARGAVAKINCG